MIFIPFAAVAVIILRAIFGMHAKSWPTVAPSISSILRKCFLGTTKVCPEVTCEISKKARTCSSSYTLEAGISPAIILQKMQSVIKFTSTSLDFVII